MLRERASRLCGIVKPEPPSGTWLRLGMTLPASSLLSTIRSPTIRSPTTIGGVLDLEGGESTSSFESKLMIDTLSCDKAVRLVGTLRSLELGSPPPLVLGNLPCLSLLVGKRWVVDWRPSEPTYLEGSCCRANAKSWLRRTKFDEVP